MVLWLRDPSGGPPLPGAPKDGVVLLSSFDRRRTHFTQQARPRPMPPRRLLDFPAHGQEIPLWHIKCLHLLHRLPQRVEAYPSSLGDEDGVQEGHGLE